MNRNIQVIFVISVLVVLILCSACTSQPPGGSIAQEGGLSQVTIPVDTSGIGFAAAQQALEGYRTDSVNGTADINSIYYIIAKDVDESGNAASWVFGIGQGAGARLLVYDKTGWTVFPWNTQFPEKIALDQIIAPDTLFARNKAVIITGQSPNNIERRDLELRQGIYTLTINSGNTNRILTFNATTGALIT